MQLWGVLVSGGLSHAFDDDLDFFLKLHGAEEQVVRVGGQLRRTGKYTYANISPEVGERLRTVMLRRVARDLVDLPQRIYQDLPVAVHVDAGSEDWSKVDAEDKAFSEKRQELAAARASVAIEFAVEASRSMQVLVFSSHVAPIRAFANVKGAGWFTGEGGGSTREDTIARFQRGELRILAMTVGAGGVGLDLSRADGVLFVDLPYTPGELDQAEARALRVGKATPVIVWRMVSDHPIDKRVLEILEEKRRLQGAVGLG